MKQPVWDLPVRLFHWLLAALIGFRWWSVKYDHASWHIWSGCAILTLLIYWNTTAQRVKYDSMADNQTIAYISDVGASHLKPLFVTGCVLNQTA